MSDLQTREQMLEDIAPSPMWQNWFHSERDAVFGSGDRNPAGYWPSPNLYATQALAEEAAEESMIAYRGWVIANGIVWVGAYPQHERPKQAGGE